MVWSLRPETFRKAPGVMLIVAQLFRAPSEPLVGLYTKAMEPLVMVAVPEKLQTPPRLRVPGPTLLMLQTRLAAEPSLMVPQKVLLGTLAETGPRS